MGSEPRITVMNNGVRDTIETNNVVKKQGRNFLTGQFIITNVTRNQSDQLSKSVYACIDAI